ncbi:MAG: CopD family protein [Proteobacteria bacterium]|jgi:protoporphyrinogen IX oxidase|nr:CopD family protein [Pseudomonadota bacterium]MDA1301869.1 CopD family protein [Pseudomonadota bacterium]
MLWIKTAHVLFVMAWMAGIFYLPRIFVHYAEGQAAGEDTRRLVTMAHKLARFSAVMAFAALGFGTWLWLGYGFEGLWLHLKLGLVVLLIGYHLQCFRYAAQMREGRLIRGSLFFRIFNESTLLLLVPILILVIVKPV